MASDNRYCLNCGKEQPTRYVVEYNAEECVVCRRVYPQPLTVNRILGVPEAAPKAAALPTTAAARKGVPVFSGFMRYFPKAIAAVAELSRMGNDQHNPGEPLHWAREKSGDELDAQARHMLDRADNIVFDVDGCRHSVKNAWRAMANAEKEIEAALAAGEPIFKHGEPK